MTDLAIARVSELPRVMTRVLAVEDGPGLWGAQRWLLRLAPLLRARGVDLVLASPDEAAINDAWRGERVVLSSSPTRTIRTRRGVVSPRAVVTEARRVRTRAREIAGTAAEVGATRIVANSHWAHADVALAGAYAGLRTTVVLHEESFGIVGSSLRGCALWRSSNAIAVSGAVADSVPAWARSRVVVAPNGVDVNRFRPSAPDASIRRELGAVPEQPIALVLCRLDRHKGVDDVIRAVAATRADLGLQLAIAGAPSFDVGWDRELERLGAAMLGNRVRFLGARDDAMRLIQSADMLVLASSIEGMPLSILEAHSCARPVVAYATAGIPELVRDGETGILVSRGDVAGLASGMERLATDRVLRERMGRTARVHVERSHDIEMQADDVAEALGPPPTGRR